MIIKTTIDKDEGEPSGYYQFIREIFFFQWILYCTKRLKLTSLLNNYYGKRATSPSRRIVIKCFLNKYWKLKIKTINYKYFSILYWQFKQVWTVTQTKGKKLLKHK